MKWVNEGYRRLSNDGYCRRYPTEAKLEFRFKAI